MTKAEQAKILSHLKDLFAAWNSLDATDQAAIAAMSVRQRKQQEAKSRKSA